MMPIIDKQCQQVTCKKGEKQENQTSFTSYLPGAKELEDWQFAASNTQYATHGMHTWLAAMIPALARRLIRKTQAASVIDPFCGGGAVCVESVLSGLPTTGVDINPLAAIITKAKTTFIEHEVLSKWLRWVLHLARDYRGPDPLYPDRAEEFRIKYWFKPYMLRPLSALSSAVSQINEEEIRTFFQCVLSATARDVSLTHRNEIRLRLLEPKERRKFNPNVFRQFNKRAADSIERVQSLPRESEAVIKLADTRHLPFDADSFTTLICSPPYGDERNGVPYFQFAKNMLYWLGFDKKQILESKNRTIGWVGKRTNFDLPESPLVQLYSKKMLSERSRLELLAFHSDYFEALKEMARVTSDKMVIVIGNRVLQKNVIDNPEITTELLGSIGVGLESHYFRLLPSKRLPKLTDYGGGGIDKEHILVFDVRKKSF